MSLYLKYRPKKYAQVIGNEAMVEALQKMTLEPETCPHAILFHGPTGCGKTTLARIIGGELGVIGQDLREMDTADFRGIDVVREIRKQAFFQPLEGPRRMWILDEAHKMTNDAQNALLKILEDTPSHVYFVICTTDPKKLLPTIRGRCSQFEVKLFSDIQMQRLLIRVCKSEGEAPKKSWIKQIIQDSLGHPRNALQTLDQVLRVSEENRVSIAKQAAAEQNQSIELCRALLQGAPWKKVSGILKGLKDQDPESIRRHVLGYAQAVLLNGDNLRAGLIMEEFIEPFYDSGFAGVVFFSYSVTKN